MPKIDPGVAVKGISTSLPPLPPQKWKYDPKTRRPVPVQESSSEKVTFNTMASPKAPLTKTAAKAKKAARAKAPSSSTVAPANRLEVIVKPMATKMRGWCIYVLLRVWIKRRVKLQVSNFLGRYPDEKSVLESAEWAYISKMST